MKEFVKRLAPLAAYLGTLVAGAALGRVVIPASIDEARMQAIAQHVVMLPAPVQATSEEDGDWRAIREMNKAWPGHIDWVRRYSDQARTLFEANGQKECPGAEVLRGVSRCVFVAPSKPFTIRKLDSLPPMPVNPANSVKKS